VCHRSIYPFCFSSGAADKPFENPDRIAVLKKQKGE